MKLKIEINMDNAAFDDNENELLELLQAAEYKLKSGYESGPLRDSNGNKCGFFEVTN